MSVQAPLQPGAKDIGNPLIPGLHEVIKSMTAWEEHWERLGISTEDYRLQSEPRQRVGVVRRRMAEEEGAEGSGTQSPPDPPYPNNKGDPLLDRSLWLL